MYCCFLNFAWTSFSIFGSSYMCKPCTFPVSASDLCIEGWRILYQELVISIFSVIRVKLSSNSYGGSFWSFCRSLFRKCWTTELSIHLFSVNTRLKALVAKNGLHAILRLRCRLNLALNRVSQQPLWTKSLFGEKVHLANKSVWLKSQFSHKSVQPATPLPHPHPITCLWSPILAINIIQNSFVRWYCDSYYISVWLNLITTGECVCGLFHSEHGWT